MEEDPSFRVRLGWGGAIKGLVVLGLAVAILKVAEYWGGLRVEIRTPWFLVPAFLFQVASVVGAASVWQCALLLVTGRHLRDQDAIVHMGILLVAKYIPGKVWGMVGRGLAVQKLGVSPGFIATATVLEQVAALASGGALVVVGLYHGLGSGILATLTMFVVLLCPLGQMGLKWVSKLVAGRWVSLLVTLQDAVAHLCSWAFGRLFLLACWQWFFGCAMMVCIIMGIGVEFSFDLVVAVLVAVPAAIISGFLVIFVPGGFGVREGIMVVYLQPVIGLDAAFTASILLRIFDTVRDIALGSWSMGKIRMG